MRQEQQQVHLLPGIWPTATHKSLVGCSLLQHNWLTKQTTAKKRVCLVRLASNTIFNYSLLTANTPLEYLKHLQLSTCFSAQVHSFTQPAA